jgi:hypothetical protein
LVSDSDKSSKENSQNGYYGGIHFNSWVALFVSFYIFLCILPND